MMVPSPCGSHGQISRKLIASLPPTVAGGHSPSVALDLLDCLFVYLPLATGPFATVMTFAAGHLPLS